MTKPLTTKQAETPLAVIADPYGTSEAYAKALGISVAATRGRLRKLEALNLANVQGQKATGDRTRWDAQLDAETLEALNLDQATMVSEKIAEAPKAPKTAQTSEGAITKLEKIALFTLDNCAQDASGGDFGFFDELDIPAEIKGVKGMAALVGSLMIKGLIWSDSDAKVNGKSLGTSQYGLTDEAKALVKALRTVEAPKTTETPAKPQEASTEAPSEPSGIASTWDQNGESYPRGFALRARRIPDDDADVSFIGHFSDQYAPGAVDHHASEVWLARSHRGMRYFHPANPEYAAQAYGRLCDYLQGGWGMIGLEVTAYLEGIELGSASLWGVESDSNESYILEVCDDLAQEAIAEAREHLTALAIASASLPCS